MSTDVINAENNTDRLRNNLTTITSIKSSIKTAIRNKNVQVSDDEPFTNYASKISLIETGIDTSDATAVANEIVQGKTAYARGEKITGTIKDRTNQSMSRSGIRTENNTVTFSVNFVSQGIYVQPNNNFSITAPYSSVAEAIGLTADKLLEGETILGITGTLDITDFQDYQDSLALSRQILGIESNS